MKMHDNQLVCSKCLIPDHYFGGGGIGVHDRAIPKRCREK